MNEQLANVSSSGLEWKISAISLLTISAHSAEPAFTMQTPMCIVTLFLLQFSMSHLKWILPNSNLITREFYSIRQDQNRSDKSVISMATAELINSLIFIFVILNHRWRNLWQNNCYDMNYRQMSNCSKQI